MPEFFCAEKKRTEQKIKGMTDQKRDDIPTVCRAEAADPPCLFRDHRSEEQRNFGGKGCDPGLNCPESEEITREISVPGRFLRF